MKVVLHAAVAAVMILGVATAGKALTAKTLMADRDGTANYASLLPESFGDWKVAPSIRLVTPVETDSLEKKIYSQMVGRGYVDSAGNTVMLLVAYGPRQSDRLQLHRPEICYVAEGFRVSDSTPTRVALGDGGAALNVRKLVAVREGRVERITYWMRIGDDVVSTLFARQVTKMRYGLQGLIPDGVLFRISTINLDAANSDKIETRFLSDLLSAVPQKDLHYLVGSQALRPTSRAAEGAAQPKG